MVDSGDGVTHVIPVVEGHVIGSSIKSLPFAGRDITRFIQQLLRSDTGSVQMYVVPQMFSGHLSTQKMNWPQFF